MSEYTTRQILDMIEENGGPERLDLSGKDLTGIDLGKETVQAELEKAAKDDPETKPTWLSASGGITLVEADLRGTNLARADLQGAQLLLADLRGACLWGADLGEADLRGANLQEVELSLARLLGADLWRADLEGADLEATDLRATVLDRANLQGARLWGARLEESRICLANLRGADLWGARLRRADLSETDLQHADLRATDLREARFYGARLDHTEIDQKSLGPAIGEETSKQYERARDAYLRLKENFDGLGDYAASAWAYQKERQMEKRCNAPWRARRIYGETELGDASPPCVLLFYARHTVKWIFDWIVEYLCGYGENPVRVLLCMTVTLFGFATYYWSIAGVWLVDPGERAIASVTSFWHYLIYGLGAFTTTQFATFQPADDRVRLLTGIQAIWGIFLAGLMGFVVANKIRRS